MQPYTPKENETLRISNLTYGLIAWFYNHGRFKSCTHKEALALDQRCFGPAYAKGLLISDGQIIHISESGIAFLKSFENRSAWKDHSSRQFSHYVKFHKSRLHVIRKAS